MIFYFVPYLYCKLFFAGWIVEFRLGASLLGKTLDVFINHPLSIDEKFERHTYYQLQWINESANIQLTLPGSFHYYVTDQ